MHAVNSASQVLNDLMRAGWKQPQGKVTKKTTEGAAAASAALKARKALAALRKGTSNKLEIERAAVNVVGKLIALEMFDDAFTIIEEIHPQLCAILDTTSPPAAAGGLHLLSLDIPPDNALDDNVIMLTTTYLLYALTTISRRMFNAKSATIAAFSQALHAQPTLIAWRAVLPSSLSKHADSLLTRAYTALTRGMAGIEMDPLPALEIRCYALTCLALTTPNTVDSSTFWGHVNKCLLEYASRCTTEKDGYSAESVLPRIAAIVSHAEGRPDANEFMSGPKYLGFCETWTSFARRAGDLSALERISALLHSSDSSASGPTTDASEVKASSQDAASLCTRLAQLTVCLESSVPQADLADRIQDTISLLQAPSLVQMLAESHQDETGRAYRKVDNAVSRLLQSALRIADVPTRSGPPSDLVAVVRSLLRAIVSVMEIVVARIPSDTRGALIARVLETLTLLARTQLVVLDPRTHMASHDCLERAAKLIQAQEPGSETAKYLRYLSAALYNMGATLFSASQHSACITFLRDSCELGRQAVEMRSGNEEADEGWQQLEEQLYRRWEILGICQSKAGNRKAASDAFKQAISSFPYDRSRLAEVLGGTTASEAFTASDSLKHLAAIVDRVTYIGACELLLQPQTVSLRDIGLCDAGIVGALLERQIQSLASLRWKESVRAIVRHLLLELLDVYEEALMPLRRIRTLLMCLEFKYHCNPEEGFGFKSPWDLSVEIQGLLASETMARDVGLLTFTAQYRAMTHLWLGLLAHRRADPEQIDLLVFHSEEATKIFRAFISTRTAENSPKSTSKAGSAAKSSATKSGGSRRKVTTSRIATRTVPSKKKPAPPPVNPVTPKAKPLQELSLNVKTPPRPAANTKSQHALVFDDFGGLLDLLRLLCSVLNLLGLTLVKVRVLDVVRRLAELKLGPYSDDYANATTELAFEYFRLGKYTRAKTMFNRLRESATMLSPEVMISLLLRYAGVLAELEDVAASSAAYSTALDLSQSLPSETKGLPPRQLMQHRLDSLERAALASRVFSLIQLCRSDVPAALDGLLRSLQLLNRAMDGFMRFYAASKTKPVEEDNPFQVAQADDAGPPGPDSSSKASSSRNSSLGSDGYRVAEAQLDTLFALSAAYLSRGSAREAEYFIIQALDLSESLNAPPMVSRALAKKGEILLLLGDLENSHDALMQATQLLPTITGDDAVDLRRLQGDYTQRSNQDEGALQLYEEAIAMLEELNQTFTALDGVAFSSRKSLDATRTPPQESVFPQLLSAILARHLWLLRDNDHDGSEEMMDKLRTLSTTALSSAEITALEGRLALHEIYSRFRSDMFLSSIAESTIAVPMGMSCDKPLPMLPSTQDLLKLLQHAEGLFWSDLNSMSKKGTVSHVREAAISLAIVRALQTSLGLVDEQGSALAGRLLDTSTAVTLRREMLEVIAQKFPDYDAFDDLQWREVSKDGSAKAFAKAAPTRMFANMSLDDDSMSDDEDNEERALRDYWARVKARYDAAGVSPETSVLSTQSFPSNWTIVHIAVTEDKRTLFLSRQEGGEQSEPLVFCIPLQGRRDNDDDEEYLSFDDALSEMGEIIRLSNESTKSAVNIRNDPEARQNWWKERAGLDTRLKELLQSIEFCWLGGFKTILGSRLNLTPEAIDNLRKSIDKVFDENLRLRDKKPKGKAHRKTASQSQNLRNVQLDDHIVERIAALGPKCADEELEDFVYFILDLYQFHGVQVSIAEVDIVQVIVDLRAVLEEESTRARLRDAGRTRSRQEMSEAAGGGEHLFLVLDKNVQGIPWESIPILRGRSVSRIPSLDFLIDRVEMAKLRRGGEGEAVDRAVVDPRDGYYVLNPSGDLVGTEGRFKDWAQQMKGVGWDGVIGQPPSEQQLLNALRQRDLVVYFGHGGADKYARSHKIRQLPRCAATMLWGCSSGFMKDMGDFDRVGIPNNYMLAGCPTLVANMWDVTDRDIDKFTQSVIDKMKLVPSHAKRWDASRQGSTSVVAAVAQSRDVCKLKYLTGAAPVVYGIPFYL
ncbi:uncharacterized protein SCHCODRAFT_01122301 [Schizophyllum commune H4-8]|uniref:uncharacterized protein n=1 Tax=Schizophyllum commune (strain H4-8 / FGSC 9210) TaxID=578458 RepID=UPI00215DF0A4|nr:uncharacterized protein SCHCODRAFT_01122301 [Schizophyllum commune H4-8]KAI5895597.1 hypothetical protein SCHCODRAFT_01122301 [Schizophyllum commune H4-8]